ARAPYPRRPPVQFSPDWPAAEPDLRRFFRICCAAVPESDPAGELVAGAIFSTGGFGGDSALSPCFLLRTSPTFGRENSASHGTERNGNGAADDRPHPGRRSPWKHGKAERVHRRLDPRAAATGRSRIPARGG